jgi:tetratricopeptide (TPR) repeat protein
MDRLARLKAFVEESPDDPFPLYGVAMEHKRLGDFASADATFEALRTRFPDYLPQYLLHGQVLEGLGRRDDAAATLRRGLEVAAAAGDAHAEEELQEALDAL